MSFSVPEKVIYWKIADHGAHQDATFWGTMKTFQHGTPLMAFTRNLPSSFPGEAIYSKYFTMEISLKHLLRVGAR
jgi:hypothetical protein